MSQLQKPQLQKPDELLVQTFARLDAIALGVSCGVVFGVGIFAATVILLIKGGEVVGPNLTLLSQYFIGYSVTWTGSIVGAVYGLLTGFIGGWVLASVRNFTLAAYLHAIRLWAQLSNDHFLDRFDS
jgi:hypothetical protein